MDPVGAWLETLEKIRGGRLDCREFVNEKHCYLAEHLAERLGRLREVWAGRDYAVVATEGGHYLLGRDGDGHLFINKVEPDRRVVRGAPLGVWGRARVFELNDEAVRALLGYDRDAEGREYTISGPGRYRVQGDVVVTAEPLDEAVTGAVGRASLEASRLALAHAVHAVLTAYGLEAVLDDKGVAVAADLGYEAEEVLGVLAGVLAERLGELLGASLTGVRLGSATAVVEPTAPRARTVLVLRTLYGGVRVDVAEPPAQLQGRAVEAVRGAVLEHLRAEPADARLRLGRHTVVVRHARPGVLEVGLERLVESLWGASVRVQLSDPPSYVVGEGSEVRLLHPWLGEKTLRFGGGFIISIGRLGRVDTAEVNTAVLRRLARSRVGVGGG